MSQALPLRRLWVDVSVTGTLTLFVLMLLTSLSEGIGILLLVPLLSLLQGGSQTATGLLHAIQLTLTTLHIPLSTAALLTLFAALVTCRSLLQFTQDKLSNRLQLQLVDRLRVRCFNALMRSDWRWLSSKRQSDHANLILSNISRVGQGFNYSISLTSTLTTIFAYLIAAFSLSISMTTIALVSGCVCMRLLAGQRKAAFGLGQKLGEASRALQARAHESLGGMKLAKILGAEQRLVAEFAATTDVLRQQQTDFTRNSSLSRALLQLSGAILLAVYLYIGLTFLNTPAPTLLTLVFIFSRLIPLFTQAQQLYQNGLQALPASQEAYQLLDEATAHAEPTTTGTPPPMLLSTHITLERVSVSYPDRDRPALREVSLRFPARTTTAIMGASGAGKSTLADVLMGLITADHGTVRVDDQLLTDSARMHWRASVAYVPQEVFLFHATVADNLRWGHPEATDTELADVLKRAAAAFVFQLPLGLQTVIGDGGVLLSGGERQRLALARALLKKPTLLILDEATSALDVDNEARIRDAIEQLHGDLTVILIGHRLPTLEHADQVIILDHGQVIAHGSWAEVKAQQGRPL